MSNMNKNNVPNDDTQHVKVRCIGAPMMSINTQNGDIQRIEPNRDGSYTVTIWREILKVY